MNGKLRLASYGVAGAILLIAAIAAPAAWATPGHTVLAQTVPTRTPAPAEPTSQPPENAPAPTSEPAPTSAPAPTTAPAPQPTAQGAGGAAAGPTCGSTAKLTLVASQTAVVPGATVTFTATLTNTGTQPLAQVVFEQVLASGLEPVAVVSGGGDWQGQGLRTTAASLDPSASLTSVYTARVAQGATARTAVARTNATTAGCPRKTAAVTLGLPPSELPTTGGNLDQ